MPAWSLLRAVAVTSLAASGLAATLAGCGSQVAGAPARPATRPASPAVSVNPGGPDVPAPSAASPAPPKPGGACGGMRILPAVAPAGVIELRNSSNGETFCVQAGQRVDVYLTGAPGRMWASIRSDSGSLVAVTDGQLTLPVGVTGAFFAARHGGVAHLSSVRQVCGAERMHCDSLVAFRATIIVNPHT